MKKIIQYKSKVDFNLGKLFSFFVVFLIFIELKSLSQNGWLIFC